MLAQVVTPRMGRVSRNYINAGALGLVCVTPRMGRVSRNHMQYCCKHRSGGHAPHGACE